MVAIVYICVEIKFWRRPIANLTCHSFPAAVIRSSTSDRDKCAEANTARARASSAAIIAGSLISMPDRIEGSPGDPDNGPRGLVARFSATC